MMRSWKVIVCSAAAWLGCWVGTVCAQPFPNRPVTLMVPWPAGGTADFVARILSRELAPVLGHPVVVENLGGAGGSLGAGKALGAPADGHTLLLSSPLDLILAPMSFPATRYQPEDARAIAILGRTDLMLVTRKDLGVQTLAELVALTKARPEKPPTYCAMGSGSLNHLVGEKMAALAGVKMLAIPYSGLGPCVNDMVAGQVDVAYLSIAGPIPGLVENGSLKALAVLGDTANRRFPKVPLAKATPGFEDFSVSVWAGIHVSAAVPEALAVRLNEAVNAALARPELRQAVQSSGATVFDAMSLAQAQELYMQDVKRHRAMWAPTPARP